jgi:hypothetical protein
LALADGMWHYLDRSFLSLVSRYLAMSSRLVIYLPMTAVLVACIGTSMKSWQADQFVELQPGWYYYRWADPPLPATGQYQDHILSVDRAVREQLNLMLSARGYQQHQQRAQFEVDYRVGDESVVGLPGPLSPTDEPERIFAGPNAEYEVSSRFYTHRTLAYHQVSHLRLSLYDIQTKRIVWESSASKLVDDPGASAAKVSDGIAKTTRKIFKDFPPASQY